MRESTQKGSIGTIDWKPSNSLYSQWDHFYQIKHPFHQKEGTNRSCDLLIYNTQKAIASQLGLIPNPNPNPSASHFFSKAIRPHQELHQLLGRSEGVAITACVFPQAQQGPSEARNAQVLRPGQVQGRIGLRRVSLGTSTRVCSHQRPKKTQQKQENVVVGRRQSIQEPSGEKRELLCRHWSSR
jgi:hypothetical protein